MFKSVSDSAAAADGGSLALFVERIDGQTELFVINRSSRHAGRPTTTRSLRAFGRLPRRVAQ